MDVPLEQHVHDLQWLMIPEEGLFFSDSLVNLKYHELDEGKADEERETKSASSGSAKKSKKEQEKEVRNQLLIHLHFSMNDFEMIPSVNTRITFLFFLNFPIFKSDYLYLRLL